MVVKKFVPVPPPLPVPSTTINHPNGFLMNKNKASSMQRNRRVSSEMRESWDHLFDDAYRADVMIRTDSDGDNIIYAHACILGFASPVFRSMLKQSRNKYPISIPIRGAHPEAVRTFIRFLYSSCYEEAQMKEHVVSLLVLSHAFAVPRMKRECEYQLEHGLLNVYNAVDVFQLSVLCDAPRLTIISHRYILNCFKAATSSTGWKVMKKCHPSLEKELLASAVHEDNRRKEMIRKSKQRKIYLQLYEAMEALVHICRDGCRTICPHDKEPCKYEDKEPCKYEACKGLESLLHHFAGCKLRVHGGCLHCKRMWQLLELHARLCANSDVCKVPLCKNFKQKIAKQNKRRKKRKENMKWKILVKKILRTKSITGGPYFTLAS